MPKPITIQHPLPTTRDCGFDIFPIGLYCNTQLQTAKSGDVVCFQTSWKKKKRELIQICRLRVNSPEFSFMLRHIYGMDMTIAKLMTRWQSWAIVEGFGKDGFSKDMALLLDTRPYDAEFDAMKAKLAEVEEWKAELQLALDAQEEEMRQMLENARNGVFNHKDIL